jgi:hypothetical protein
VTVLILRFDCALDTSRSRTQCHMLNLLPIAVNSWLFETDYRQKIKNIVPDLRSYYAKASFVILRQRELDLP